MSYIVSLCVPVVYILFPVRISCCRENRKQQTCRLQLSCSFAIPWCFAINRSKIAVWKCVTFDAGSQGRSDDVRLRQDSQQGFYRGEMSTRNRSYENFHMIPDNVNIEQFLYQGLDISQCLLYNIVGLAILLNAGSSRSSFSTTLCCWDWNK